MTILVIGKSGSGKSTAAAILAEMMSTSYGDTSAALIDSYSNKIGISANEIIANKGQHRKGLWEHGRSLQASDPAILLRLAMTGGATVVTGARNKDEIEHCGDMFDIIVWIERSCIPTNETDQITSADADMIINNDGTLDDLTDRLRDMVMLYGQTTEYGHR